MLQIIFAIIFAIAAWKAVPLIAEKVSDGAGTAARIIFIVLSLFCFASTSWINVGSDEVAHLKRNYLGTSISTDRVIALDGETGKQAEILMPGFKFRFLIRVVNDIEYYEFVNVPTGSIAVISAVDGEPLREGQAIADAWVPFTDKDGVEHKAMDMLNATTFLTNGGQKGEQLTVLKPGQYAVNAYLFKLEIVRATSIAAGTVGVVTSRVEHPNTVCPTQAELLSYKGANEEVSVPLVPTGCIGVWSDPLLNGYHFINPNAYKVTVVPTLVQTWKYKGGYTKREIVLTVGKTAITQQIKPTPVPVPKDAADSAISSNVEGWTVPTEFSLLIQVPPAKASMMVASVGTLSDVENKIGTRALRSSYRDTVGGRHEVTVTECSVNLIDKVDKKGKVIQKAVCPKDKLVDVKKMVPWKILELITERVAIENSVETALAVELARAGVILKEVQMGHAELPTGLLATRQREQLADQQRKTFIEEEKAQVQRQSLEAAEELANMQDQIVQAKQAEQIAKDKARAAKNEGEGERDKLKEIAKGERARVNTLGVEATLELAKEKQRLDFQLIQFEMLMATLAKNPDLVKVPLVDASSKGGAAGQEGAAAVLGTMLGGNSNVAELVSLMEQRNKN